MRSSCQINCVVQLLIPASEDLQLQREENPVSVYMGVPTMYNYLLSKLDEMSKEDQEKAKASASRLRLSVSGSAACPVPIMKKWKSLSGIFFIGLQQSH